MQNVIFRDADLSFVAMDEDLLNSAQDILNHNGYYHSSVVYTQPAGLAERCLHAEPPAGDGSRVFKKFILILQNNTPVAIIDVFVGFPNYKTASIAMFMVHDGYHKKGIATKVLSHALPSFLREVHPAVQVISISLTDNNVPALRCLLKCQYERTNTWAKHDANGRPITAVTFKRSINDALNTND